MGGTPTQHHTKSRRNKGRSHQALKKFGLTACTKCGSPVLPHRICDFCGSYSGRLYVDVMAKLDKKERKKREKEQARKEKETAAAKSEKSKELSPEELSRK